MQNRLLKVQFCTNRQIDERPVLRRQPSFAYHVVRMVVFVTSTKNALYTQNQGTK